MHSDFLQRKMERGLIYWTNHSWEIQQSNEVEEEVDAGVFCQLHGCELGQGALTEGNAFSTIDL
jgi:hypothetical protein